MAIGPVSTVHTPQSSNIDGVNYYHTSEEMTVVFKNGDHAEYYNVSQYTFLAMVSAESVGGYYNQHIKGNSRYRKGYQTGEELMVDFPAWATPREANYIGQSESGGGYSWVSIQVKDEWLRKPKP